MYTVPMQYWIYYILKKALQNYYYLFFWLVSIYIEDYSSDFEECFHFKIHFRERIANLKLDFSSENNVQFLLNPNIRGRSINQILIQMVSANIKRDCTVVAIQFSATQCKSIVGCLVQCLLTEFYGTQLRGNFEQIQLAV